MTHTVSAIKFPQLPGRNRTREVVLRRFAEIVAGLAILSLLALILPLHEPAPRSAGNEAAGPRAIDVPVVEVLDGDTLLVRLDRGVEKIRLIGVDSPEAVVNDKALLDAQRSKQDVQSIVKLGRLASQHTRSLVAPGTVLHVTFDRHRTDRFGRLLGYVYLPDNTFLNERIIADGFASARTYPPNDKFDERLERAYKDARVKQRGLWRRRDHRILENPDPFAP